MTDYTPDRLAELENNQFECQKCFRVLDIEDSVRRLDDGELWCVYCQAREQAQ